MTDEITTPTAAAPAATRKGRKSPTTTPEAAMQRVWQAEIKTLETQRRKIARDFAAERAAAGREARAAEREMLAATARWEGMLLRHGKAEPRATAAIDRRLGFLKGRLGLL